MPRSPYILAALPALALVACSGAQNQDLFEASVEQDDTSAVQPAPAPPPGKTETGKPSAPPAAPNENDPPEACTPEKEPNDDAAEATPFKTGLCGEIESGRDVDYGSFVVPPNAKSITWDHTERDGEASYRFFLGLGNVPVPELDDDTLQAIPGATYLVQIRRSSSTPTYELTLTFN